jgi:hypothetical protein
MYYIKGKIKDDKTIDFTRKDGTPGQKRTLYLEPIGSIYPVSVNVPLNKSYGKVGDSIELKVKIYPFSFNDKQRQRAFMSIYVPEEADNDK